MSKFSKRNVRRIGNIVKIIIWILLISTKKSFFCCWLFCHFLFFTWSTASRCVTHRLVAPIVYNVLCNWLRISQSVKLAAANRMTGNSHRIVTIEVARSFEDGLNFNCRNINDPIRLWTQEKITKQK